MAYNTDNERFQRLLEALGKDRAKNGSSDIINPILKVNGDAQANL